MDSIEDKKRQVAEWIRSGRMTEDQVISALYVRTPVGETDKDAHEWGLLLSAALSDFERFENACLDA